MAFTPTDDLIVTVNMERTSAAGTFPSGLLARRDSFSSLSPPSFSDQLRPKYAAMLEELSEIKRDNIIIITIIPAAIEEMIEAGRLDQIQALIGSKTDLIKWSRLDAVVFTPEIPDVLVCGIENRTNIQALWRRK